MRSLLLFALLSLVPSASWAADPEFSWEDDGTLRALVHFDAPISDVEKLLSDPVRSLGLSTNVKAVTATPKGECQQVFVTTTGIASAYNYTSIRCPTARGFKDELVSSEDYAIQESEWVLDAVEGGTRGVLRTRTKLTARVPKRFVKHSLKKSIERMLGAMQKVLSP